MEKNKIFVRTEEGIHRISEEVLTEINKYADLSSDKQRNFKGSMLSNGERIIDVSVYHLVKALCYSIDKSYEHECIRNY